MRMYPEHAHALFALVRIGTPVRIIYQRLSIGYQPQDGIVYLAHYADPYGRGDATVAEVQKALASVGLSELADEETIKALLAQLSGVPMPLVGSWVKVLVDGKAVRFALNPIRFGRSGWSRPGPLAKALGAKLELGPEMGYVGLERGDSRLLLTPGKQEALVNGALHTVNTPPQLVAGYPLLPLKETVAVLGGSIGWDDAAERHRRHHQHPPRTRAARLPQGPQDDAPLTSAAPAIGRG